MVKFSNKGKAKPSKRQDLKVKYKIKRKVRQHNKKMKRQAKKMKAKGLRKRKNPMADALPNSYPFKQQILQQYKKQRQILHPESLIDKLSAQQFQLITIKNQSLYFPKSKDAPQKKYINNIDKLIDKANIILFTLDARLPTVCRDQQIQSKIQSAKIALIYVLTKCDTVQNSIIQKHQEEFKSKGLLCVRFATQGKHKSNFLEILLNKLNETNIGLNEIRRVGVIGKANTGKHSLVRALIKNISIYNPPTNQILEIHLNQALTLIDTPLKIDSKITHPIFTIPLDSSNSKILEQETLLKQLLFNENVQKQTLLNRDEFLSHYNIQDFISIDDLQKKVGKSLRIFGKGGMVDLNKVRNRILSDWYAGRLNNLIMYHH